jgi:hypothetical protein
MKKPARFWKVSLIVVALLAMAAIPAFAAPPVATSPALGAAVSYSVLAGAGVGNLVPQAVNKTGPAIPAPIITTTVSGDLGVSPGVDNPANVPGLAPGKVGPTHVFGFPPGIVGPPGTIHDADAHAAAAQTANIAAFGVLSQTCGTTYQGMKDLGGLTLAPGVYCADAFELSGTLTLSGTGVWIFRSATTLVTSEASNVVGGDPCNVWWQVRNSATLGPISSMVGSILASEFIDLMDGATLNGRALAQKGSVSLFNNAISTPACAAAAPTAPPEVPEASSLLLMGSGLGGLATWLGWQRARRGKATKP